jgi:acetylornithine deacetylase
MLYFPMILDPIQLTLQLMAIDSTSGREAEVGHFLLRTLRDAGFYSEPIHVPVTDGPERFNVYACVPGVQPDVVLSTHMDTVPPYIAGSEDDDFIYGRGSCDAKGIIASQIAAAQKLAASGEKVGFLFTVGEELDSAGAKAANKFPKGNRFLINGEPTDNRIAIASKGTLRLTLRAKGKMAHSAYPELGDSAVHKLVSALDDVLKLPLPMAEDVGACTLNIGTIHGGHAPNVIADEASARVLVRLIGPGAEILNAIKHAVGDRAEVETEKENPFIRLTTFPGMPTMVAAFATDIPSLSAWGKPLLFGPGSIHVAHTPHERLAKKEMHEAIGHYVAIAKGLLHGAA